MKVLLVDDSTAMRRIQKNLLLQIGVTEVDEAGDGKEALEKLAVSLPDVVFMDWNMPKMNGLTALQNIRANEATKAVKVIMCTSESEKTRILEAIKAGANSYVVKPFTPEILKEKLRDLKLIS